MPWRNLSFRSKLILAMSLIVCGVTGATMIVTEKRVQATYLHLFEQQFSMQIQYFSENRLRQLEIIANRCEAVSKSVRLLSAVEEAVASGDTDIIYDNLETEIDGLRRLAESAGPGLKRMLETRRGGPLGDRSLGAPLFAVTDAKGNVLEPGTPRESFLRRPNASGNNKAQQFQFFAKRTPGEALKGQEIGYMAIKGTDGQQAQLREFIVTPLVNQATEEFLGTLIMGFRVQDFGESAMYQFSDKALISGIWLDRELYTKTIPEGVRATVAERVAEEVQSKQSTSHEDTIGLDGVPHRLFYKILNPDSIFPPAAQVCLFSMKEVVEEQQSLRTRILGFGSLALLGGIFLVMVISHGFSKPIEELVKGTRRIADGDFSVKVPVRSKDEIGVLASSFNNMTDELALKERYKAVLAQVTDKEVAEQLISGKMALGGELRVVSVIFCDIRGFTAHTEGMPPEEVIAMLNEHMTALNRVVHDHYGVVDKFVGDLIMAVFGAPKSYGNDALHAAKCALAMLREREKLNQTSRHHIEVGIGLATGEVVAGCMGSEDRLNYTVLGERVNLASRLCSKAGRNELLIDEMTLSCLPEGVLAEPTEPMPLKGFSELVAAYRLLGMVGDSSELAPASVPSSR